MKRNILLFFSACSLVITSCTKEPANKGYAYTLRVEGEALSTIQIHTDRNYTVTNVPLHLWRSDGQATGGDTLSITATQTPNLAGPVTTTIIYSYNNVTDSVSNSGATSAAVSIVLPK